MTKLLWPTKEELQTWLVSTLQHVQHIEYFLHHLDIQSEDPERPHDLVGPGNKYQLPVMRGLALHMARGNKIDFDEQVIPSLQLHRQQRHHQLWNPKREKITVSREDMRLGAIDSVCSRLENRGYQEQWSYDRVIEESTKKRNKRDHWMEKAAKEMRKLPQPKLEDITSLTDFPNLGIPPSTYTQILQRTKEMRKEVQQKLGYQPT